MGHLTLTPTSVPGSFKQIGVWQSRYSPWDQENMIYNCLGLTWTSFISKTNQGNRMICKSFRSYVVKLWLLAETSELNLRFSPLFFPCRGLSRNRAMYCSRPILTEIPLSDLKSQKNIGSPQESGSLPWWWLGECLGDGMRVENSGTHHYLCRCETFLPSCLLSVVIKGVVTARFVQYVGNPFKHRTVSKERSGIQLGENRISS